MAGLDHGCQLVATLQTWAGMVLYEGLPKDRTLAMAEPFFRDREAEILASAAHLLKPLPIAFSELDLPKRETLVQNLWACTAQSEVTGSSLVEYIKRAKRLDVEQAVAMVLSFVSQEIGSKLAPLVGDMFVASHMWRTRGDFEFGDDKSFPAARERKLSRLRAAAVAMAVAEEDGAVDDDLCLISVLKRVRRDRSALASAQRLCFPKYLLALLPEGDRAVWSELYTSGLQRGVEIEPGSVIEVKKTPFARIQRWLLRLDGDTSDRAAFVREVRKLEREICFGDIQLQALETTDDRAALAFSFLALQRRLQLKVVSDDGWTEFLKKGQGGAVLQNRADIVTSFEEELASHATDVRALVAIRPPRAFASPEHSTASLDQLISQVDEVCTAMEQYVLVFGDGLFENLRFSKTRSEAWKGRGPEDVYNLLVDLLGTLRERGAGRVSVAPCHKFLAKDIMAWNDAWLDDAFAPGKIPGWVQWLQDRRKLRLHLDTQTPNPEP